MRSFIIASLLFVLCFVSLSFQASILCSDGAANDAVLVQCLNGQCVDSTSSCPPISPTCANSTAYGCLSGTCTNNPNDCLVGTTCYQNTDGNDLTCWNGACVADFTQCPTAPACPQFYVRCEDGSCQLNDQGECGPETALNCTTDEQQSNSQWCLCKLNGPQNCNFYVGCPVGQYQCPDGRCSSSFSDCAVYNKKNKTVSRCKINEFFIPCYGKDPGGECVKILNESSCPLVAPAFTPVYPITAYVGSGPTDYIFDVYDYSLQNQIASIRMAPFLSTGNIRIDINNNISSAVLYNSTDNLGWPSGRSPFLSIYSPILRISSPELAFTTDSIERNLLKKTFHLHVTFYNVAKPAKASEYQVCLGFLKVPYGVPDPGVWECKGDSKDTKQIKAGKGNYTYTAMVSMDLLTINDSDVYIAMVYDGGKFKEAPITIGGGFFAAGFILVVVLTTVVLANRERLVVWGESLVGGGE